MPCYLLTLVVFDGVGTVCSTLPKSAIYLFSYLVVTEHYITVLSALKIIDFPNSFRFLMICSLLLQSFPKTTVLQRLLTDNGRIYSHCNLSKSWDLSQSHIYLLSVSLKVFFKKTTDYLSGWQHPGFGPILSLVFQDRVSIFSYASSDRT